MKILVEVTKISDEKENARCSNAKPAKLLSSGGINIGLIDRPR